MICFFRDMCIDAMQTFANIFRGIVNVISNISCEEVEDFASACIVVILCTGAVRMLMNFLRKVGSRARVRSYLPRDKTVLNPYRQK